MLGLFFSHFYHMSIKLRILDKCLIKPNLPKRHSLFSTKGQDFNFNVCQLGLVEYLMQCLISRFYRYSISIADFIFAMLMGQYEKRVLIQWWIQGEGPGGPDPPPNPLQTGRLFGSEILTSTLTGSYTTFELADFLMKLMPLN